LQYVSEELYEETLKAPEEEAHRDWLDVAHTADWFWGDFDHVPPYAEIRPFAIRAVSDLINAGAVAGDIIAEGDRPWRFEPWQMTPSRRSTASRGALRNATHISTIRENLAGSSSRNDLSEGTTARSLAGTTWRAGRIEGATPTTATTE